MVRSCTKIRIGSRTLGDGEPALIIAEAGLNHDGKLAQAKSLIQSAAEAGADAIKFQIYTTEELCGSNSALFALFKSLEFSKDRWLELADYAKDYDIIFTASVFGESSADLLETIGSPMFKIASGDLTYLPLLGYVAKKDRPIVLSTGMSTLGEIEDALNEIYKAGTRSVVLMHCVSTYPTAYEDANLRAIETLKYAFGLPVGFSDHTEGTVLPVVAVALGANAIEKHMTPDRTLPGPDHFFSLEPPEYKAMVERIRLAEQAVGDGIKRPTAAEQVTRDQARRFLTANTEIAAGATITRDMVKTVRSNPAIEPKFVDLIIGRTTKRTIAKDQAITWQDV
jgi:N,N'-diacetyllegionaminate synthase